MSINYLERSMSAMSLVENYSWEQFLEAYKAKNNGILNYFLDYNEFYQYSEKNYSDYIPFFKKALKEMDPQYLLNTFIDALLTSPRFVTINDDYFKYIEILIEYGAKIPIKKILFSEKELSEKYETFSDFEEDILDYPIRVSLMQKYIDKDTIISYMKYWNVVDPRSLSEIKKKQEKCYNDYIKYNKYSYIKSLYLNTK